jgi:hypothetical protein
MKDIFNMIRIYNKIKRVMASYGYVLPKIKGSLILFMLYEICSRESSLFYIKKGDEFELIPEVLQKKLGMLHTRFVAYHRLLAYDDGVEIYNLTSREIYGQLVRCMTGFIVGLSQGFPINLDDFQLEFKQVSTAIQNIYGDYDKGARQEIFLMFENGDFLRRILQEKDTLNFQDILYSSGDRDFDDMFNITIVAGLELGKTLRQLYKILLTYDIFNEEELRWHREFIMEALVKSGYAQANTAKQRRVNEITWSKYIEISYGKSNSLLEITSCFRSAINKELFFQKTFNEGRFCEQFYLDDLQDFNKDSKKGILGVLHIFLIEQGRLAKQLLPSVRKYEVTSQQLIIVLEEILSITHILDTHYQGVFIYRNSITAARRDEAGNIILETDNTESIIREMFVTSKDEIAMPLTELLSLRISTYEMFCEYWNANKFIACANLIYKTSIPTLIITGFIKFLKARKEKISFNSSQLGWYYFVLISTYKNLLYFQTKKWQQCVLDSSIQLRDFAQKNSLTNKSGRRHNIK